MLTTRQKEQQEKEDPNFDDRLEAKVEGVHPFVK
jgi:hypothetical protein